MSLDRGSIPDFLTKILGPDALLVTLQLRPLQMFKSSEIGLPNFGTSSQFTAY